MRFQSIRVWQPGVLSLILASAAAFAPAAADEEPDAPSDYWTFTDNRGWQIEACVLRIDGDQVTVQDRYGQESTVPIASLSRADQDYLRQLARLPRGASAVRAPAAEHPGLAAQYPDDRGLADDPHVVFAEDFEGGALLMVGWEQEGGFYDIYGFPDRLRISTRDPAVGRHCLELVHPAGEASPQWLHRKFPGQDTLYVRFYRKFETDWVWAPLGIHDTIVFAGHYDSPAAADQALYLDISGINQHWSRNNALADTVLTRQPLLVLKSSYQGPGLDFGLNREIVSHVGWDNYYALADSPYRAPMLEGGRWYCFEMMAKMNSGPGRRDGEVRLWVDDQLITEMTGLVLRNDSHASIQWDHWMLGPRYGDSDEYGTGPPRELLSWFDGLVVATQRIGPAVSAPR